MLEWSYKHDTTKQRHVGPTAEEFNDAFALRKDRKTISPSDMNGLALAAIQGLNEIVTEKDAEITELRRQNEDFANRLAKLEEKLSAER